MHPDTIDDHPACRPHSRRGMPRTRRLRPGTEHWMLDSAAVLLGIAMTASIVLGWQASLRSQDPDPFGAFTLSD